MIQEFSGRQMDELIRLRQIYNLCPVAILELDTEGVLVGANKTFRDIFYPEYTIEQLCGKGPDFLKETTGIDWVGSPSYLASQGTEISNLPYEFRGRTLLLNAVPLWDGTGEIIGSLTINQDITQYEQERMEHEKALAMLDRINLVSELVMGVAHEIRNPLTVIKGYLQIMEKKSTAAMGDQLKVVLSELERVEQLISNFLSLSNNKATKQAPTQINSIIKHIVPMILSEANMHCIEIETRLDENLPLILLDEKEITQLILNLLKNGIEAIEQQGVIVVETSRNEDSVCLVVSDSGCGINKEYLDKIFDPFFTTKDNGTGLGLSVCMGIVRRHEGTLEVLSQKNQETKFIITIPIKGKCRA